MAILGNQLALARCPHCNVDKPSLIGSMGPIKTTDYTGANGRIWRSYACVRCGGVVTAAAYSTDAEVIAHFPSGSELDNAIPNRARNFLTQAIDSLASPSGAIMLSASAVDAMLKEKGLKSGTLYGRIDKAAEQHLITPDMAAWAHEVRLDANEERHADEDAELPGSADARRAVDFTIALAQLMFVLPARVSRGIDAAKSGQGGPK